MLLEYLNIIVNGLKEYGFNLRKLRSNHQNIADGEIGNQALSVGAKGVSASNQSKVLGLIWDSKSDEFTFESTIPRDSMLHTKRSLLSEAGKIFDPLGWLSPLTIKIKILFQKLWLTTTNWNDELPPDVLTNWLKRRKSFEHNHLIKIKRWIGGRDVVALHGFADASQNAFGVVVYAVSDQGSQIMAAKTKVAPINRLTLPRLELQAAVLLTELMSLIEESLIVKIVDIVLWSDSQIVLDWLSAHPSRWKEFIANRTAAILNKYPRSHWNHIGSELNPADCASRGVFLEELVEHNLWWTGPSWLRHNKEEWPISTPVSSDNIISEEKLVSCAITRNSWLEDLMLRYHSFHRLCSILSVLKKCIKIWRTRSKAQSIYEILVSVTTMNINEEAKEVCKYTQKMYFSDDYRMLKQKKPVPKSSPVKLLHPFIGDDDLIRVGGRIDESIASYSVKHPIILPRTSLISKMIAYDYHQIYCHAGVSLCLSLIRRKYWIIQCKQVVRHVIRLCVSCIRAQPKMETQLMGTLPKSRLQYIQAFTEVGVDYCGPFNILMTRRRGAHSVKVYVCLFVGLSSKAVHIEVVGNLTTESFIGALQRFIARRGLCKPINSDNGTNLVGTSNYLSELHTFLMNSNNKIHSFLLQSGIQWQFIPAAAPHIGGLWEASVKLLKLNFKRTIGNHVLTIEEFTTVMVKCEGAINSRPICIEQADDVDPLAPAHLAIGRSLIDIPEPSDFESNLSTSSKWKIIKQIYSHFWRRWHLDYLHTLQRRSKWHDVMQNIRVGDVVLVADDKSPSTCWPIARVVDVHPGSDHLVRVVSLKMAKANTIVQRPVQKICKLPVGIDIN